MKARAISLSLTSVSLALLGYSQLQKPHLKWLCNVTESAPKGLYCLTNKSGLRRGIWVAAQLRGPFSTFASKRGYLPQGIPILKTIWAEPGDRICWNNFHLTASEQPNLDIARYDRLGRRLPYPTPGCVDLKAGEFLLISNTIDTSFDGRYFGLTSQADIIGKAEFIAESCVDVFGIFGDAAGARAEGAEGKIKARSAKSVAHWRGHSDFYSATLRGAAPCFPAYCNDNSRKPKRYFTTHHNNSQPPRE